MQKTILIFGGGENQLTLIKAAKELEVRSVVIDPDPEAPGKRLADCFEVVGSSDYELTKEIAIKYKIEGIVTSQMENPLRLMAKLAEELNFIFPSQEVIERCRNKYLMKQAFLKHNIRCASGILIKKNEEIVPAILLNFKFPLIIKPADSHSSRGVYRVTDSDELLKYEKESRSFSSDGSLILEEFIEGPEFSVEALTWKGVTTIIQFTEKIITPYPRTVELGHFQPADLTDKQKTIITKIVNDAIIALGIENAATHTELKLSKLGPFIIEIGARLGGDYIASYLTIASTGVNMDKAAIEIALGGIPDLNNYEKAFSIIKYLELPKGRVIQRIGNWKGMLEKEDVVHANVMAKEGDTIQEISDSSKGPGFIIVKGRSKDEVIQKVESFYREFVEYIILN